MNNEFYKELTNLISKHGLDKENNTPCHILAEYVLNTLNIFGSATSRRSEWYGSEQTLTSENKTQG